MENDKKCACKGIRTCLLCEKEGQLSKFCGENEIVDQYVYCPHCNLCWSAESTEKANPLYLGRLTVIPDFITEDEEAEAIAAIDSIEWMPSQSGRKKQDFGPKVNFKKKKGKIGDFKGFPRFTEKIIQRLELHKDLSDFKPVELCHLDYDPDRGSAIEPHIDDSWIWGERLVTINLASPTILVFTSANCEANCDCCDQGARNLIRSSIKDKCCCNKVLDDQTSALQSIKQKEHLNCKVPAGHCDSCSSNRGNLGCSPEKPIDSNCHLKCNSEDKNITCDCCIQCIKPLSTVENSIKENKHCNHKVPVGYLLDDRGDCVKPSKGMCSICDCYVQCIRAVSLNDGAIEENGHCDYKVLASCSPSEQADLSNKIQDMCTIHRSQDTEAQNKDTVKENRLYNCNIATDCSLDDQNDFTQNPIKDSNHGNQKDILDEPKNHLNCPKSNPIIDMCTEYRIGQKAKNVEVLVPLPQRSLVVVAGCCRHNWFHEIKRKDIVSRRLAMTFRELSQNFMAGGPDQALGTELLDLGRTFLDKDMK